MTACDTISRAIAGNNADLALASFLIDHALEALCPHHPASRFESCADTGRIRVTCTKKVTWYATAG